MLPKDFNRKIVDIGAGSGYFSRYLAKRGLIDQAFCVDTGYSTNHQEQIAGTKIFYASKLQKSNADVALFMDVLEHVKDDVLLLRSYLNLLPQRSTIIITVPAFNFLWSGHDIFLGHYRRYTRVSLYNTIVRAGYRPVNLFYYYALVFPIVLIKRLFSPHRKDIRSNLKSHCRFVNNILYRTCRLELNFMTLNNIVGLSVCATCVPE